MHHKADYGTSSYAEYGGSLSRREHGERGHLSCNNRASATAREDSHEVGMLGARSSCEIALSSLVTVFKP